MITSPGGRSWSSSTWVKASLASTMRSPCSLMSVGIDGLLERRDAGAAEGVEEPLALLALAQIDLDHLLDRLSHTHGRQGRAQHLAQGRLLFGRPAEGQLIELLA